MSPPSPLVSMRVFLSRRCGSEAILMFPPTSLQRNNTCHPPPPVSTTGRRSTIDLTCCRHGSNKRPSSKSRTSKPPLMSPQTNPTPWQPYKNHSDSSSSLAIRLWYGFQLSNAGPLLPSNRIGTILIPASRYSVASLCTANRWLAA